MNVPYKWQARIVVGDYYLNQTNNNKKNEENEVKPEVKPETEQKTMIELEVADDNVNETVLNALAMLNKVFIHEQKAEELKSDK